MKIATIEEPDKKLPNPRVKRQKISDVEDSTTIADSPTTSDEEGLILDGELSRLGQGSTPPENAVIKVVRLAWVQDSLSAGKILHHGDYLVHEAVKRHHNSDKDSKNKMPPPSSNDLLRRAQQVAENSAQSTARRPIRQNDGAKRVKFPPLLPQSTTEEDVISRLPTIPEQLRTTYSCQRSTVVHPPNETFIEKLKEVRELRKMTGDEIGVRAYSSAIASLSAYPYKLQSALGLYSRLPQTQRNLHIDIVPRSRTATRLWRKDCFALRRL